MLEKMMARDWDREWDGLATRERTAFRVRNAAFGEIMPIYACAGAPDMDLLARLDVADKAWKQAKADCRSFIEDCRRAL